MSLPPLQTVSTGLVVAIVGFFSSFPIVLQGLTAMGATPSEASSGLMAASLSMGLTAIVISLVTRQPSSVAWSTPGAAFLAVSLAPAGGFAEAVGAFLIAGALTVLAGIALLGVFANSASVALADAKSREATAITFLTTASGVSLFGLSGAVWGLLFGGLAFMFSQKS